MNGKYISGQYVGGMIFDLDRVCAEVEKLNIDKKGLGELQQEVNRLVRAIEGKMVKDTSHLPSKPIC